MFQRPHVGELALACLPLILLLIQPPHLACAQDAIPSWTNSEGKVIQAEFAGLDKDVLVIRGEGKVFRIPLDSLTQESQLQAVRLGTNPPARDPCSVLAQNLVGLDRTRAMLTGRIQEFKRQKDKFPNEEVFLDQIQLLKRKFNSLSLTGRKLRIQWASHMLRSELSVLACKMAGRIENLVYKMTDEDGNVNAASIKRAETLLTVSMLLLSSEHLRSLGSTDAADRIAAEADLLEKSLDADVR